MMSSHQNIVKTCKKPTWFIMFFPYNNNFPMKNNNFPWKTTIFIWQTTIFPWKRTIFPWKTTMFPWKRTIFPWKRTISIYFHPLFWHRLSYLNGSVARSAQAAGRHGAARRAGTAAARPWWPSCGRPGRAVAGRWPVAEVKNGQWPNEIY